MSPPVTLTLTADQHALLRSHLFPGDGCEAVAFALCGRAANGARHRLLAREIILVDHAACRRAPDRITWPSNALEPHLERAEELCLSVIKIHSHPGGFPNFSNVDDASDAELLPTMRSWVEHDIPHGSAVMLPDGRMFGRYLWRGSAMNPLDMISIAGPSLHFWWASEAASETPAYAASQDQAFGEGTTRRLRRLKIGIVGISGTGSPLVEQLMRLGVGHLVLVDDDRIEHRNLNRITNATAADANERRYKVEIARRAIDAAGLGTMTTPLPKSVMTPEAVAALADCDLLFGCVDTIAGRFVMNLLASHYLLPYFDLGVLLDAVQDGPKKGTIRDIFGSIHYLVPGRSSLLNREVISLAGVRAEGLHRDDPSAAAQQVKDKYIPGLAVSRPAVISINMLASSLAVNDFLARLHRYRRMPNEDVASIEFSLGDMKLTLDEEIEPCPVIAPWAGHGDRRPLLGLPELQRPEQC
jgi:ThiF family/Prokaryotic homologs of the JAB domain